VLAAHAGTLWAWHVPRLYEAALHDPILHAVEHASLLGPGLLFWSMLGEPRARWQLGFGTAMIVLFAAAMQCSLLGALLTMSERPWYLHHATTAPAWGLDAVGDQHLAGVLMWVPGGTAYLIGALAVLLAWLNASARVAR
jgi:cytochrome c oxidase assembly factor CtaG